MDALDRMFHVLVRALQSRQPALLSAPFTVGELHQQIPASVVGQLRGEQGMEVVGDAVVAPHDSLHAFRLRPYQHRAFRGRMRIAAQGADLRLEPFHVLLLLVAVVLHLLEQGLERRVGGDAQPRVERVVELDSGALEYEPLGQQID